MSRCLLKGFLLQFDQFVETVTDPLCHGLSERVLIDLCFSGTVAIALVKAMLSDSGSSTSSADEDLWRYRRNDTQGGAQYSLPDTSVGCIWGDRKYNTCH